MLGKRTQRVILLLEVGCIAARNRHYVLGSASIVWCHPATAYGFRVRVVSRGRVHAQPPAHVNAKTLTVRHLETVIETEFKLFDRGLQAERDRDSCRA